VRLHARYHYDAVTEQPRQAVTSACPRRPLRARPRCIKRRARGARLWPRLRALNGPVPYPVRMTLERPEPQAQKNLTLEGCDYPPVASKSVQRERAPQVPSIYEKLLISGSRAGTAENPRSLQMRKDGGHLAATP
jgi:hypothetical protein